MLNLPTGLVQLNPDFTFKSINQRFMRHITDDSKIDLSHPEFKKFATKLADIHQQQDLEHQTQPFGILSNSILENSPSLFLVVPVFGDMNDKNIFVFAFKQDGKFLKEEILHDREIWHDINNPLTILMMASSKIDRQELLHQEEIDKFFSIINEVTSRINKLGLEIVNKAAS